MSGTEPSAASAPVVDASAAVGGGRTRLKAYLALGVAAVAIVGFYVGMQEAMRRVPPDPTPAQADSIRRARAAEEGARRGAMSGAPDAPGARRQPSELPRLR